MLMLILSASLWAIWIGCGGWWGWICPLQADDVSLSIWLLSPLMTTLFSVEGYLRMSSRSLTWNWRVGWQSDLHYLLGLGFSFCPSRALYSRLMWCYNFIGCMRHRCLRWVAIEVFEMGYADNDIAAMESSMFKFNRLSQICKVCYSMPCYLPFQLHTTPSPLDTLLLHPYQDQHHALH